MAEYRDLYQLFLATGTNVVAVSVDASEKSEAVRQELQLPFPILSDTQRRVVRAWGIYNPHEKGGIAKPAVFLLAPDRTVRFASVDEVASRIPAREILRCLKEQNVDLGARRKALIPGPRAFFRAIRNAVRMGMVQKGDT